MPARALLGTANGLCKEVHLLPVSQKEEQEQQEQQEQDDLAAALEQSVTSRTKLMREQDEHQKALLQQEMAQQIAWGQMERGTAVIDMVCVPGAGGVEAGSVVFTATVHEPHKKITEPELRTNELENGSADEVQQAEPVLDDAEQELHVYSVLECHAQSAELTRGSAFGTSMRVQGLHWTEGASVCVARTQEPVVSGDDAAAREHGQESISHVPGRIVSIAVLNLDLQDGRREACLVSCTSSGDVSLHRVVQSAHELSGASATAFAALRTSVRPISQLVLGNVGSQAQVMRLGRVLPTVTDNTNVSRVCFDVLTGGQEHDMRVNQFCVSARRVADNRIVLDTDVPPKRTFLAKNLPDDRYRMRPKVWLTDMQVLSQTPVALLEPKKPSGGAKADVPSQICHYRVACVTKYGQYRVYDTSVRRRCVLNVEGVSDHPLQCLALADFRQLLAGETSVPEVVALRKAPQFLVAGDSVGATFQLDPNTGAVVAKYKQGSVGALRRNSLAFTIGFAHKSSKAVHGGTDASKFDVVPLLISAGLDRTLRCHHALTRRLIHRVFVKQQINCVLPLPIEIPKLQQSLAIEKPLPKRTRRRRRHDDDDSSSEDDADWGVMDEADLLASVRSAPADQVVRKPRGRRDEDADVDDDSDDMADDMEAAAALAVVETQMNAVRKRSGKNVSAPRADTERRLRLRRDMHDREKRDYAALSGKQRGGNSRDKKRSRR